jgi:hypothetical protein
LHSYIGNYPFLKSVLTRTKYSFAFDESIYKSAYTGFLCVVITRNTTLKAFLIKAPPLSEISGRPVTEPGGVYLPQHFRKNFRATCVRGIFKVRQIGVTDDLKIFTRRQQISPKENDMKTCKLFDIKAM